MGINLVQTKKSIIMKSIYLLALVLIFPTFLFSQNVGEVDEIAPFSEGLAAVRKGNQWGFINEEAKLVIDFRDDLVWNKVVGPSISGVLSIQYPEFKEGRCLVKELKEEDIPYYGFIDTTGKLVIAPDYLNITAFEGGYAIGIFVRKTFRGQNEFQLNIYDYTFTEVLVNTDGEIVKPISERDNILMSKRRYQIPELKAKMLTPNLLAQKGKDNRWEISQLKLSKY